MYPAKRLSSSKSLASLALAIGLIAGGTNVMAQADGVKVNLGGAQEVPPVTTSATGSGTIAVGADKSVSGSVTTTGLDGTMAHIHIGAAGKNGGVVIPLTKVDGNTWTVPAGAKLNDEQYAAYQAGNLYVNVHTTANKGGEIRAQITPK
jgi:hypothetical protein